MLLTMLKYTSSWDHLDHMFQIKGLDLNRPLQRLMTKIYDFCVERIVNKCGESFSISEMQENNTLFNNLFYCLEAFDLPFQQANKSSGNMQEKLVLFRKPKMFCVQ